LRTVLEAKVDSSASWEEFWEDHPEWDRDDFPEVDKYH